MDMQALMDEYEQNHQSTLCKVTHAFGIPMIAVSIPALFIRWRLALLLFALGWTLQFAGHAAEGKPPKFFEGSQYFLAGMIWWLRLATTPLRKAVG